MENDFSAEQRNQFLGDGQSQTGAFDALGTLQSGESVEHLLFFLVGHSLARILYAQGKHWLAHDFRNLCLDGDAALVGIFDGVAYQVIQNLTNAEGIGTEEFLLHWRIRSSHSLHLAFERNAQAFLFCSQSHSLYRFCYQLRWRERSRLHFH